MALVMIENVGAAGVIQDLSPTKLPASAWTDVLNARFLDGMAFQTGGHGPVYSTPLITPYHVMPVNVGAARHWLYAGANKVYDVSGSTHTNITKQVSGVDVAYGVAPNQWTSTSLSGIPILNPGNGPPQQWDLNVADRLTDLANWPSGYTCKSLRAFNNQLVALGVTKGATAYPYLVLWSTEADPGTVPSTWDVTDAFHDAGEVDVAEGGDPIIDGMQLGGTFVIYKQQSTWRMDYAGGQFVEQFTKVGGISGALNVNCIAEVEIDGVPSHVVLTPSDVIVHDGQTARSVLDRQLRRTLFSLIDAQATNLCFVFKNPFLGEVFICFPEGGETTCTKALVWNYKGGTCSFRQLPNLWHAAYGPVETGLAQPWDGDATSWDADTTRWNASEANPDTARVLMASNDPALYLLDSSTSFNGQAPAVFLERAGLTFAEAEFQGLRLGPHRRKLIGGIRPLIAGTAGQVVTIKVGGADNPYDPPTYLASMTYTIGSQVSCDCLVDARYGAIRFESNSTIPWRLDGYQIDVVDAGMW